MDRNEILAALTALAEELQRVGIEADMYLVGGAALALAFDVRRSTRDIDAVFVPKMAVYEASPRPYNSSSSRSSATNERDRPPVPVTRMVRWSSASLGS